MRCRAPVANGKPGAVSLLQRFDASLGLDPHVHLVSTDGAFTVADQRNSHRYNLLMSLRLTFLP